MDGAAWVDPVVTRGVFRVSNGRRSYPVAWVLVMDGERRAVVRKGLGIHEPTPDWPEGRYAVPAMELYGDPLGFARALGAQFGYGGPGGSSAADSTACARVKAGADITE